MKKRLLACLLTAAMLVSLFPLPALAAEAQRPEWMVTAFDPLDGDTAAQTVPQGGEPVLPDSLTAWAYVIEDDTAVIPPTEGLAQEDEQLPSDSTGEPFAPLTEAMVENELEPAEKQEPDIQPVTIPGVIWEAQPEFDPDTPGEYVYTSVLPAAYEVAGEVELPVISVTVTAAEQTSLQRVEAMIDALPAPEDITPDNRDEVEAQLEAIGEAWAELSDTEALLLDTARLEAAQEALAALDGQAGNELPAPLTGETGNFTVTGGTSGTDYSYADNTLTILTDKDLTISGTTTTDKIVIQNGTTANVTIDNLKIDVSSANNACAFEVAESATCNLTLTGENVLKSGQAMAALRVPSNASLTIVSESDGSLDATGGKQSAGIGSNSKDTTKGTGSISIHSGTITATGGEGGAGIGGGWSCSGGTITINGGTVTITGGKGDGAGIGGGRDGAGGTIIINGGTVTASGQWSGAGIGGGGNGAGGKITINGGTVTAIGNSAGIGGGTYGAGGTFDTGTNGNAFIVANGGISDKTGQDNWSGIIFDGNAGYVGGSQTLWMTLEIKSNQTLTVANNSTLTVPEDKALINSGIITNYGTISGTLTNDGAILVGTNGSIPTGTSGGTIKRVTDQDMTYLDLDGQLKAISDLSPVTFLVQGMTMWNSGCYVAYGDITLDQRAVVSGTVQLVLLDGCSLNAKSGIDVGEPNSLTIYGQPSGTGQLTAKGGAGQAGIGGAYKKNSGVITINGGTITATGGAGWKGDYLYAAAGIGGGDSGAGGTITINGGIVTATGGYCGAGIGGGRYGAGGAITINGGFVTATGGESGAGIGGGYRDAGGAITISGGTVNATGGYGGAGIGNGENGKGYTFEATGNAFIIASSISDQTGKDSSWSGVIFERNEGKVYGSPTLKTDATIPSGKKLEIPAGKALPIDNGVTLTNNEGEIINNGTLQINETGKLVNNGTITNNSTNQGITGNGAIEGSGKLTGSGTIAYTITNNLPTAPTFTTQPSNVTVSALSTATFIVAATCKPNADTISYKWQVSKDSGKSWKDIHGATNANYTTEATSGSMNGWQYRCVATNSQGSTESRAVTLTVNKLTPNVNVSAASGLTYNGSAQALISGGTTTGGELQYSTDGTYYSATVPTGTDAKPYTVYYKVVGGDNYENVAAKSIDVTIAQKSIVGADIELGDILTYTGQQQTQTVSSVTIDGLTATYNVSGNTGTNATNYTLTVTGTGNFNGTHTKEFTIAKATNSITGLTCADIVFGESPDPSATATFGTPTYSYSNEKGGTYEPWNIYNAKGTWYVKATIEDTGNYNGAEQIISFQVTAKREATPSASIDYGAETLTGLTVGASYSITPAGGTAVIVTAGADGTIAIQEGWFGKALSIVKKAQSADHSDSEPQSLSIPARPATPTAPLKLTKTASNITITNTDAYSGCEFFIDGTNWSSSGTFNGLTAGTAYTVQVRVKAAANAFKSASMTQAVTTVAADGSTTVRPGESVETGDGKTITNDGDKTTITDGGTTTTVTPPSGGGDVSVGTDGGVTVPGGSTVQTGDDGPEITVGGKGGTIGDDGEITIPGGGTVQTGDPATTITPPNGGTVKPKEDGTVEVPEGTIVKPGGGGPEVTVGPGNGGTVGDDGGVTVEGGGKVTVKGNPDNTTITLPSGGGTVKPNPDGTIPLPGNSTVEKGGTTTTVPGAGGTYHPDTGTITENTHTVTFDSQGGSAVASVTVAPGGTVAKPTNPTRSGYTFGGWYKESGCTTAWNFDTDTVTGDITLYAKWTQNSNGGGWYNPPTTYSVTIPTTAHGKVAVSPTSASRGAIVTITAVPEDGYRLSSINVTSGGKNIALTEKGSGKYTFTMPAGTVKVTATFVPAETPETPWNNPFADVSEGDWYYEAVRFVQERGLMNGYSDGRFGPNDTLSRAQLAQILFNREGRPGVDYLPDFSDVAGEAWYTEAVRWAASQGIVSGYGNGTFGPNDPITREQLAVMLWRYSGSPAATNKELHFNDTDEISPFALEALRWAVENGILNGYGDGRLGPQGQATRAQVAQMLKNFIENQEDNS